MTTLIAMLISFSSSYDIHLNEYFSELPEPHIELLEYSKPIKKHIENIIHLITGEANLYLRPISLSALGFDTPSSFDLNLNYF